MNTPSHPPLREVITGRPRPRHLRFAAALAQLVPGTVLERRDRIRFQRLRTNVLCRLTGVRVVDLPQDGVPVVLHQALASTAQPYAVEYDVPLAVHGYGFPAYLRHADKARRRLENPALRTMFVFSEWAKRSFLAHFGEEVGAKCRVSYPLAAPYARCGGEARRYDFTFISTQFRIKGGPELVRAFAAVRASGAPDSRLCVVTDLAEARLLVGDLERIPGIDWREASLDERAVADLLADTHCLVHPSLSDSFGVVVLEALAAGCAVITTPIASFPELAAGGSGVLVAAPVSQIVGDFTIPWVTPRGFAALLERMSLQALEDDLTRAMTRFATDHAYRAQCQGAARALYVRRFSPAAWADRMRTDLTDAFGDLVPES